jgi:Amt family ammonium transporter
MELGNDSDCMWLLFCTALVFLMQAGFCCLESGLSRSKNGIDAAIKNIIDFCIAAGLYWLTGYAFMFGGSYYGVIGVTEFFFEETTHSHWLTVFFLYQCCSCGLSTTIASGATAERLRFQAYVVLSMIVSGILYPIFGHWVWAGMPTGEHLGWLGRMGFIDFAGATTVHGMGAWAALAVTVMIGPRVGKFGPDGKPKKFHGHYLPLAALGLFILWFGWFGFSGGNALGREDLAPRILINTMLAGAFGALGNLLWQMAARKYISVESIINSILAGLVASCASCDVLPDSGAVFIGLTSGLIVEAASYVIEHWLKIDDVVGAVPAHGVAGAWGTLAAAIVAPAATLPLGHTRFEQFSIQLFGVLLGFVWSFGVTWVLMSIVARFISLRVTADQEKQGLNFVEHGAMTELQDLLMTMEANVHGNMRRASVDEATEAGQIAMEYNKVLDARELAEANLREMNADLYHSWEKIAAQTNELRSKSLELERAKREAERANATKSLFVANMSHEIRTPMTAILGYVEELMDETTPPSNGASSESSKQHESLKIIQRNGEHLLTVINDILDLSKIEAGRVTIETIDCSVKQAVDDVILMMKERAFAKGIELSASYLSPIPSIVQSDPTRLRQVVLNLVGNAIKFTSRGGVRIEVQLLHPVDHPHNEISIAIIDSGIGIDEDQRPHLFQPFIQADSTVTRKYGGTGLGLTISKRLANMLGGDIAFESTPGVGSTFTFTFAIGQANSASMDDGTSPCPRAAVGQASAVNLDCRILLAEDGGDNQRLISHILRKAGATVDIAENGQVAIEMAIKAWREEDESTPHYAVILMDIQMPVKDGLTATSELRSLGYPWAIVALTANAMTEDRQRSHDAGCDDFATKPIDRTRLFDTIETWRNRRRSVTEATLLTTS